jgi:hypothetical protein
MIEYSNSIDTFVRRSAPGLLCPKFLCSRKCVVVPRSYGHIMGQYRRPCPSWTMKTFFHELAVHLGVIPEFKHEELLRGDAGPRSCLRRVLFAGQRLRDHSVGTGSDGCADVFVVCPCGAPAVSYAPALSVCRTPCLRLASLATDYFGVCCSVLT